MSYQIHRLKLPMRALIALFVVCLLNIVAGVPPAQATTDVFTSAGSGTWTAPAGVTEITIECWGGGGGGGNDTSSQNNGGGGGGGGAYAKVNSFAVTPGASYNYTVGAGGTGASVPSGTATNGGSSSFNTTTCVAAGGSAGSNGNNGGAGGAGGTASSPTTGDVKFAGGSGASGTSSGNGSGGGGGGSAGTGSNGNSANSSTGATAVSEGGPGGNGGSNAAGSAPASGPGGGGGGGEAPTSTNNDRTGGNGYVGQIRITYKATPTLSVTNSPVTYNGSPQAATVTGSVAGTVSAIKYDGSATIPTNAGTYAITADFTPTDTANYNSLSAASAGNFTINKATPTLSVTNSPVTYSGSPQAATVTGSVPGVVSNVLYDGSAIVPTDAGAYAITADFTPTDSANYNSLNGAAAGNFTIDKATPTLSVTNSPVTYNGAQQAAAVTGSVVGTVSAVLYDGSATEPTNAATYAVTADFAPTDSANYNSLSAASAGNFTINKATPTLSVTNSPVTYSGSPQAASVAGSVPGAVSAVLYDGSATEPTAAGTYAVAADFIPTDGANYNSLSAAAAGNFTINKATPLLSVTNSPVTYNGSSQAASVTGSVPGTVSAVLYDGSATEPMNAGTYAVTADFTPTDGVNYNSLSAAAAGNFVIDKAATTTTVSCGAGPFTYSGSAIEPCSASVTGPSLSLTLTVTYTNNVNAGTATADASYAGDANHLPSSDSKNFTIDKATPTLSITNPAVVYTGSPQAANVIGSVAGAVSAVKYDGSSTAPTDIGVYAVTADFAPTDSANYNSLSGATAGNFEITAAPTIPTLSVNNSPVVYNGSPQAAIVTGSTPGTVSAIKYNGSPTVPTNAGTYAVTADFTPDDTVNYTSLSGASAGNFVIQKATPLLSITNPAVVFTGSPQTANVVGSVAGAVSAVKYDGSPTAPTNVGVYAVTANFVPTDSTNYNSLSGAAAGNFSITATPTTPTLSVTNSPVIYNGSPQAATVVGSTPGTVSAVKYNGSSTVPTNAGAYAITADFTPNDTVNYTGLSGASAGNFIINKAATTTTVTCSGGPFPGTGTAIQPCTATVTGPGLNQPLPVTYLNNVNAGTATASASYPGSANYLPSSDSKTFVIGKVTPTLTVTNSPVTYSGAAQAASVSGSVPGTVSAIKYNGSATVPTNAGTYAITADFTPDDAANYSSLSGAAAGSFVINKAATTTTVTCSAGPFVDGNVAIQPCAAQVTGPALNQALPVTYTNNVHAGTATASASYAGDANYLPSSDTKSFTIISGASETIQVYLPFAMR